MIDEKEYQQKIKAKRFTENNGLILRTINLLRVGYEKLSDVKFATPEISEREYLDSINYLFLSEYIMLRQVKNKEPADIADCQYEDIEAKLSKKGINLLKGDITDNSVEV